MEERGTTLLYEPRCKAKLELIWAKVSGIALYLYVLKCIKCSSNFQVKFLAVPLIPPTVLRIVIAVLYFSLLHPPMECFSMGGTGTVNTVKTFMLAIFVVVSVAFSIVCLQVRQRWKA